MNVITALEPEPPLPAPVATGVLDFVKTYRRRLPVFLAVAGAIFLIVAAYTFLKTPRYTAETAIVVTPRKAEVGSDRSAPLNDPTTDASVDTQVEVLKSPTLAAAVVDRLALDQAPAFDRLTRSPGVLERFGIRRPNPPHKMLSQPERRQAAIDALTNNIDVHRIAETYVLALSYSNPDRHLAATIANAFASAYVRQSLDLKLGSANSASTLLGNQLDRARDQLTAANAAMGRYKIAHNLMSVGGATLAEQQITALEQQVAVARANDDEAQASLSTARQQLARGSNGEDVGAALGSPVIQELRRQRADASRHLADLSTRFGPRFPEVAAAQQQVSDVDTQIQGEVGRVISNLQAQKQVAARGAASLEASLAQAHGELASDNVANVGLANLQMRAAAASGLYEQLLERVREIGTQSATTQADARISSFATPPPFPSSPNVPINLLVGLLLGLAGGIGAVVLRQGLDQGLSTLGDVEGRLRLPYLAGLPTLSSSVLRIGGSTPLNAVVAHSESAYAEGFRSLGAAILQGSGHDPVKTIVITSSLPNEGKTTAAICLARVLAMSGKRVVLVDADLRRATVARALRLKPKVGLREVIEGGSGLDDALIADEMSGAWILPLVPGSRFEKSMMDDPRLDMLIAQLKQRFEVVLFDASPILPVVDGRLLARKADAVILLARWRKTPETAVEMATHLLRQVGVTTTGVALSRVDLNELARSGYGDPAKFLNTYASYYQS